MIALIKKQDPLFLDPPTLGFDAAKILPVNSVKLFTELLALLLSDKTMLQNGWLLSLVRY
jgi:hypothetical protein